MAVYVDASNLTVRDGATAWPFDIDCHSGVARIVLDNCRYELHPLGWREKRNLARFAHLGEAFLQTQFLHVSLKNPGMAMPDSIEQRAVLSTLARWLNAPDGELGLPLDRQLLASVTLDICRGMQLAPSAFDTLDAADVEMLWQAARVNQNALPAHSTETASTPGMTRIVVMPDTGGSEGHDLIAGNKPTHSESDTDGASVLADADALTKSAAVSAAEIPDSNKITDIDSVSKIDSSIKKLPAIGLYKKADTAVASKPIPSPRNFKNRFRVDLSSPSQVVIEARNDSSAVTTLPPIELAQPMDALAQIFNQSVEHTGYVDDRRVMNMASVAARGHANFYTETSVLSAPQPMAILPTPTGIAPHQQSSSDEMFAEFAERLAEAACAAGIDVEF